MRFGAISLILLFVIIPALVTFFEACTSSQKSGLSSSPPAPASSGSIAQINAACSGAQPCVVANLTTPAHTITPLLFGEGMQWQFYGQDILVPDSSAQGYHMRPDMTSALGAIGTPILRYPGGNLADFFFWSQTVGPVSSRTAQNTGTLDSSQNPITLPPYFGADEFAATTQALGITMLITANIGTSTASDAANWLSHYKALGIPAPYWEIGNENYINGSAYDQGTVYKTPQLYASIFDQYATALRAVDPTVKVGLIGCDISGWNQTVLSSITQKADFVAVHYGYAPWSSDDSVTVYQSTLAAPEFHRQRFESLQSDIQNYASAQNQGLVVAETEHATAFTAPAGADQATALPLFQRNQNLAAAIYSALYFNVLLSRSEILMANHINPFSPEWQAPFSVALPPATGYPESYSPQPIQSAYYYVYKLYQQAGGGTFISSNLSGSPTYSVGTIGSTPALTVNTLDAVAVRSASGAALWLYLVNRDLSKTLPMEVAVNGLPTNSVNASIQQLYVSDYTTINTQANPSAIVPQNIATPAGAPFVLQLPPHSLTVVTVSL